MSVWEVFLGGYKGYASYLWTEITNPSWHNYFYALTLVSLLFLFIEIILPWRRSQKVIRKDFWLDLFYMYFNFFIFSLIIYNAGSDVFVHYLRQGLSFLFGIELLNFDPLNEFPLWSILLIGFVIRDYVQWCTHQLLHRVSWLWEFHKVHHSVKEMGFAAHLRYHWMETIVYRTIEYLPLAFLGIGLYDFFIIHIFSLLVGHYNHANITVSPKVSASIFCAFIGILIGSGAFEIDLISNPSTYSIVGGLLVGAIFGYLVFRHIIIYIFNRPEMHIWHHAKHLPDTRKFGVNFGLSLSAWDYIFGTAYVPKVGRDIEIGFDQDEKFPTNFFQQMIYGLVKK